MVQVHTLCHHKRYYNTPFANIGISSIFFIDEWYLRLYNTRSFEQRFGVVDFYFTGVGKR
jgi:hypothetical protein